MTSDTLWNEPFDIPSVNKKTDPVRAYPSGLDVSWKEAAFGRTSPSVSADLIKQLTDQVAALLTRLQRLEREVIELRQRAPSLAGEGALADAATAVRPKRRYAAAVSPSPPRDPEVHVEASEDEEFE